MILGLISTTMSLGVWVYTLEKRLAQAYNYAVSKSAIDAPLGSAYSDMATIISFVVER